MAARPFAWSFAQFVCLIREPVPPTMKIVYCSSAGAAQPWIEGLAGALPGAEVWAWDAQAEARSADYAVVWSPPAAFFASQPALKAIFNIGAGVDGVLSAGAFPPDVPVVRLNDAGMAVQMAEYVIHALVSHARRFDVYEAHACADEWRPMQPIERAAFPVGVMGLGSIGARVARAVAALDYPVYGWSRSPKSIDGISCMSGAAQLDTFLRAVRVLVCVLPLTPATENILDRRNLMLLRPHGYVINVARGRHLVEEDLLALIQDGTLAGATLDVFREEPLRPDHPFWRNPNITITPHIAAITLRDESIAQIVAKLAALQRGDAVDGCVELARGY